MKKITLLLLTVAFSLSLYCQTHLTYQGLPINGSVSAFISQLKTKGMKVVSRDDYKPFIYNRIRTAVFVNRNINSNNVNQLSIWYVFPDNEKGLEDCRNQYDKLRNQIEKQYCCVSKSYYDMLDGAPFSVYDVMDKNNKNKKIGEIELNVTESNGDWLVCVDYYDHLNSIANKVDIYPHNASNLAWADFSHLVDGSGKCYMALSKDGLYVKYSESVTNTVWEDTNILFKDNDKKTMILLLNECKNPKIKKDLFNRYIARAMSDIECNQGETYIYYDILDNTTRQYYEELNKKAMAQNKNRSGKLTTSQFFRIMCPKLFSEREYELMDKFFPPDLLVRVMGAVGNTSSEYDEFMRNASFASKKELGIQ